MCTFAEFKFDLASSIQFVCAGKSLNFLSVQELGDVDCSIVVTADVSVFVVAIVVIVSVEVVTDAVIVLLVPVRCII